VEIGTIRDSKDFRRCNFVSESKKTIQMSAVKKIQTPGFTTLRVIKGGSKRQFQNQKIINTAWLFAHASLWPHQSFSSNETFQFKQLLLVYFKEKGLTQKSLIEFCEKVCLVKRYLVRKKGRYVSKPVDWLNIHYKYGIAGTDRWLKEVRDQRKLVPEYNKGIYTLANAICKYLSVPSKNTYLNFRNQLIDQRQFDLIPLLNATVIGINYLN
jgi:hypothetical protein